MQKRYLVLLGLCVWVVGLTGLFACADEHDTVLWAPVDFIVPVSEKMDVGLLTEWRWRDNVSQFTQGRLGATVRRRLGKKNQWWIGQTAEAWIQPRPKHRDAIRLAHYAGHTGRLGRAQVSQRVGVEHRLREGPIDYALRFRVLGRVQVPVAEEEKKKLSKWYVAVQNETFFTANGPEQGFNQNRAFVGVGRKLSRFGQVEGGYQLTYSNTPQPNNQQWLHTIMIRAQIRPFSLAQPSKVSTEKPADKEILSLREDQ